MATVYPYLGGGVVSAKIVNRAEANGMFAVEVAFAVLDHKQSGKAVSFKRTDEGTIITANVDGMPISILADESSNFPHIQHRRVGGF